MLRGSALASATLLERIVCAPNRDDESGRVDVRPYEARHRDRRCIVIVIVIIALLLCAFAAMLFLL